MSRSSIERLRRRIVPAAAAGIAIGRDYVGVAQLAAADGGWRVQALTEERLEVPLFAGVPGPQAGAALARALAGQGAGLKDRYVPLHVSIPDAAVHYGTFELDQLPGNRAAQLDLVQLRFARLGVNGNRVYACQPLARAAGSHLLFGMALDGAWQRVVSEALAQSGLVPWSMNANICRQFNRFHDRCTQTSGALLALSPDSWSLWLWDAEGRPRHARARWRTGSSDHAEIALEVERTMLAYVHSHPQQSVARVFVVAGGEGAPMGDALDARLREACTRLPGEEGAAGMPAKPAGSAALSIAAALER